MFFSKILKLNSVKERFVADRFSLLQDIVKLTLVNIPFQNIISFGCENPGPKRTPHFRDFISALHVGHGGMCGHINYGLKLVLESIGYDAFLMGAKFRRTTIEGSHAVCGVRLPKDLTPAGERDQVYLIDCGCGVPNLEPIPVHGLPMTRIAGGLEYSYVLGPCKTKVERINNSGDAIIGKRRQDYVSPQDYTIHLQPRTLAESRPQWGKVFAGVETTAFHKMLYLFRYLDIQPDGSDFTCVCIRGKEVITITKDTRQVTTFDTIEDVVPAVHQFFPMIDRRYVEVCVRNFKKIEEDEKAIRRTS